MGLFKNNRELLFLEKKVIAKAMGSSTNERGSFIL